MFITGSVGLCSFIRSSVRTVRPRLYFLTITRGVSTHCTHQAHVVVGKTPKFKRHSTFHHWSYESRHRCPFHRSRHTYTHDSFHDTFQASMTVAECKKAAEQLFIQSSISEPTESASYLIAYVLGHKTLSGIPLSRIMTQGEIDSLQQLIDLRLKSLPIQYVIGEWDFRSLTLDMKPPVLIPRPETEELVGHILRHESLTPGGCFLEVGPGSGAICCSILAERPKMTCVAVDISVDACNLTKQNAEKNGVLDRLEILNAPVNKYGDVCPKRNFDFIVSNPPYIKSEDMKSLQAEIKGFEDPAALHGGVDGLDVISDILNLAPHVLNPGGSLWLEVDSTHPPLIQEITSHQQSQLSYITTITDFNKLPRFSHLKVKHRKT